MPQQKITTVTERVNALLTLTRRTTSSTDTPGEVTTFVIQKGRDCLELSPGNIDVINAFVRKTD